MENYELDTINRIATKSDPLEIAVKHIVDLHTNEIQIVVHKIKDLLRDDTDQLTDAEIEDIMVQLPILLFDVTDDQEYVGLQYDLAEQIHQEAYNEAYRMAEGTIQDKKSIAELQVQVQKLDSLIFERAYKIIKQKLAMAVEVLNAVKKIQGARQLRYEMYRYRQRL